MAQFRAETVIARPVDAVFWYVADLENMPRWLPGALVEQVSGAASERGAEYVQRMPGLGGQAVYRLTVERLEALERFVYKSVGEDKHAADLTVEYAFAPTDDGTWVSVAFVTGRSWLGRMFSPLAFRQRRSGNREAGQVLARLKSALEASG
jgi:uncharacterized protein YndB with AHSA1/START domain